MIDKTYYALPDRAQSEIFLIACIVNDGRKFLEVFGLVTAADFSQEAFSAAWEWFSAMTDRNQRIDLYSLKQAYGSHPQYQNFRALLAADRDGFLESSAGQYARDVASHARREKAIRNLSRLAATAEASSSFEEIADGVQELFESTCGETAVGGFKSAAEITKRIMAKLENPKVDPRFRTGFSALDVMLKGGMKGGQLGIIGARTGGGKTVLAMNLAVQMAMDGIPAAAFSLEMSDEDLLTRCILSEGLHKSEEDAFAIIEKLPLWVDDTSNVNARTISARIKIMAARKGVKVFIVDYLQLIGTEGNSRDSRERVVADMSRKLKIAAKENNVLVLALSQLNEAGELRESRAIEQDADIVLQVVDDDDDNWFLRVCKQRGGRAHGPRARMNDKDPGIPLRFHAEHFRFSEI